MNYEALEDELVTRLQNYFQANNLADRYLVKKMPENPSEFDVVSDKGIYWVAYSGSEYQPSQSTNHVSQLEIAKITFYLKCRKLRGAGGLYLMLEHLKLAIIGYKATNSRQRATVSSYGDWTYQGNVMGPMMEFGIPCVNVQAIEDETANSGTLKCVHILDRDSEIFSQEFSQEFS